MSNLPYNVYVCCVNFEKGGRAITDVNLINSTTYVIRRHAESFRTCVHEQYIFLRWQITGYAGWLLELRAGQNEAEVSLYLVAWNGIWTLFPERRIVAKGTSHNIL